MTKKDKQQSKDERDEQRADDKLERQAEDKAESKAIAKKEKAVADEAARPKTFFEQLGYRHHDKGIGNP